MSNSYTATAFVVNGPFGPETRKNPATKFIEIACTEFFDTGDHSNISDFWADDISVHTAHAQRHEASREQVHSEVVQTFYLKPLTKFAHEPYHQIAVEKENGWDLHVSSHLFANVAGDAHESESKIKDAQGREWDVEIPTYYHFELVNDSKAKHGMKIVHITAITDTGVTNAKLDKRGHGHRKSHKH